MAGIPGARHQRPARTMQRRLPFPAQSIQQVNQRSQPLRQLDPQVGYVQDRALDYQP